MEFTKRIRAFISAVKVQRSLMFGDNKGSMLTTIVEFSVALLVAGIVLPLGINQVMQAENSSWGVVSTVVTVLLPILAVIGIALLFIPRLRK